MLKVSLLITGVMSCVGVGWLANPKLLEIIIPAVVTTIITGATTVFAAYYGASLHSTKTQKKKVGILEIRIGSMDV